VAAGPSETLQGILEALELCMPCIPVTLCRCLRSLLRSENLLADIETASFPRTGIKISGLFKLPRNGLTRPPFPCGFVEDGIG
jgi:hypothetical protein